MAGRRCICRCFRYFEADTYLSVSLSMFADPSLVAFLKSRRSGNVGQKNEIKMEQNRPEEFVESLTVPQCGVGTSLSMQESGLEESGRRDENMKMEITGKTRSTYR